MLRQMVKIANKLDSLVLTKEADVLDRYINKMALSSDEINGMTLNTTNISPKTPEESIDIAEFFAERMRLTADKIGEQISRSPEANDASRFKSFFKSRWEQEGYDLSPEQTSNWNGMYADQYSEEMWKKFGNPWAGPYGADAGRLRAAWEKRTTATKKNPSFDNFQAWLRNRAVDKRNVNAIIQVLLAETTGAGPPRAGARLAIPPGAAAESSLPAELRDESRWSTKRPTGPSASAQATGPTGSPMTEPAAFSVIKPGPKYPDDYEVEVDRAMKE